MRYIDFPILPLSIGSYGRRKLIAGVGINDADYQTTPVVDGKQIVCPIYRKWAAIFERCYSEVFQKKHPTYIGCTVDERWHSFMAFREWVLAQPEWEGLHLDKDLLVPGNKIYGPDTCLFISSFINSSLTGLARSDKSIFGPGIRLHGNGYVVSVSYCGSLINTRVLYDLELAQLVRFELKGKIFELYALREKNPIVANALLSFNLK